MKKHETTIKKWIFHVRSDWCLCIQDYDIQYLSGWMWKVVGELVKVWQGLRDIFHRSAISGTWGKIATASCPTLLSLVMDCHIFLVGWLYLYLCASGGGDELMILACWFWRKIGEIWTNLSPLICIWLFERNKIFSPQSVLLCLCWSVNLWW